MKKEHRNLIGGEIFVSLEDGTTREYNAETKKWELVNPLDVGFYKVQEDNADEQEEGESV